MTKFKLKDQQTDKFWNAYKNLSRNFAEVYHLTAPPLQSKFMSLLRFTHRIPRRKISLGNFLSGMGIDEIFDKEFLYLNCSHFEIPRALERSAGLAKSSKFRLNEQESALSGINFWSRAQSLYYKRPTPRTYRIQLDAPSNEKARAGRSSGFPSPLPNIPIAPLRKIRSDRIRR